MGRAFNIQMGFKRAVPCTMSLTLVRAVTSVTREPKNLGVWLVVPTRIQNKVSI